MKFSVSNIALPAYSHEAELGRLKDMGITGLEVAPSRVWKETWHGLGTGQVEIYRRQLENAGIKAVGLHSLFWDHPELGLFGAPEKRERTMDFLVHLSGLCRDLGGETLIYGSAPARCRGDLSTAQAETETIDFFGDLSVAIEGHGTCYCFEPLEPEVCDFINSALDALRIVEAVGHRALKMQLDAKALAANGEIRSEIFTASAPHLVHVHVNDPDLGILGATGKVDHAEIGRLLRGVGYDRFVSIEQRMLNEDAPLADIEKSLDILHACYHRTG
jgi:sugar phosphate isomerase/epimerase